jgi:hypothetical protein
MDGGSARRKATTYTGHHNTEKRGHTSMLRAGFEHMIPVFERSKTVRALDRAAIGTGCQLFLREYYFSNCNKTSVLINPQC